MSDLIDRRAAIGLIHSLYPSAPIMRTNREQWKKKYKPYIEVEKALEQLPSVPEPEIVRCKDCKFWTHIKRTNRYWCKTDDGLYDLNPSPDDFCSRAERRTDGN